METLQIIDGKIEYIGAFGSSGSMLYAEKTGLIDSTYYGMGDDSHHFYSVTNGEVEDLVYLNKHFETYNDNDEPDYNCYYIGDKEVTEDEVDAKYNEIAGDKKFIELVYDDMTAMDEAGIAEIK